MHKRPWVFIAAALLVLSIFGVRSLLLRRHRPVAPYRTEAVQRGEIRVQVSATGTLNAVTTVQVGSQISGTVAALYADFNSRVKEGQVLAQIDPTFLKAQVAQNEADLEKARVTLRQAERDFARQEPLRAQGLASQADIDAAQTALEAAKASVKSAEAALLRAKTNLQYATIASPIDGIVISRNVDVGQTVAASLSAPTLFTIANDLREMQLEAAVDEADIGLVRVEQKVSFTVDAFPDATFSGNVQQIRLAPRTDQNVVSYTVIVRVENPEERLLPGMTANATFHVDEARDVWKVPAVALKFRPAGGEGSPVRGGHAPGGMAMARPNGGERPGRGTAIFVLAGNGSLRRIPVRPGLSDGTYTAVASDSLSEGMQVVVGMNRPAAGGTPAQGTVNPFAPGGMRRERR